MTLALHVKVEYAKIDSEVNPNQNMVYLLLRFNLGLTHRIGEVKLNLV